MVVGSSAARACLATWSRRQRRRRRRRAWTNPAGSVVWVAVLVALDPLPELVAVAEHVGLVHRVQQRDPLLGRPGVPDPGGVRTAEQTVSDPERRGAADVGQLGQTERRASGRPCRRSRRPGWSDGGEQLGGGPRLELVGGLRGEGATGDQTDRGGHADRDVSTAAAGGERRLPLTLTTMKDARCPTVTWLSIAE